MPALILVGHGSHLSPDSSAPVYAHAERLRRTGVFDEVLEVFWKEEPNLRDALDLVDSAEVYIVPLFLAEGYFTRLVLPRELGVPRGSTLHGGKLVHHCPPVGIHPAMQDLVIRRAVRMAGSEVAAANTALIIIGHGTDRSDTSGDTVYRLTDALRGTGRFAAVDCGFLDEEPRITSVLEQTTTDEIVLVPFFIAEGWHTATTIPEELGLDGPVTTRGNQAIRYSPPVGTMPEMAEAIVDVAASTAPLEGATIDQRTSDDSGREPAGPDDRAGESITWAGTRCAASGRGENEAAVSPFRRARTAFIEWIQGEDPGARTILQLAVLRTGPDSWRLTHLADTHRSDADLRRIDERRQLQDTVRTNASGEYRPLRTRNDLPAGWVIAGLNSETLCEAIEVVYPGCILRWHDREAGSLDVVSFRDWAARQTGIYESLRHLTPPQVLDVVSGCCTYCLRDRVWPSEPDGAAARSTATSSAPPATPRSLVVPCREPCSLFGTIARERVRVKATG